MTLLIAGVFAFLGIYPFVVYPLVLRVFASRHLKTAPTKCPSISLLFCCHNEEASISSTLERLRKLVARYPNLSIYIYLDGCTDRTEEIIREANIDAELFVGTQQTGKNTGLNKMLAACRADIVAFTDANVLIDDDAFQNVIPYFSDPSIGCVCGHLIYVNEDASPNARIGGLQWRLEEYLKRSESRSGSTPAVDGSLFFARRSLVSSIPVDVPNDFFTSMRIMIDGFRVVSAPDVRSYERASTDRRDEFRRKVRIGIRAMTCHLRLRNDLGRLSPLDRFKYYSHKWVRWFAAYWFALAIIFLCLWIISLPPLVLVIGGTLAASAGALAYSLSPTVRRLVDQMVAIGSALVAAAYGVTLALGGVRRGVWKIPQTSR